MAQRFAISGLPEARAYAAHPTLGRLGDLAAVVEQEALRGTDPP